MSKIFETQFKNGSLLERYSGNQFTLAAEASFLKSEKGLSLNLPSINGYGYTTLPSVFDDIGTNDVSISLSCKINNTDKDLVGGVWHASYDSTHYILLFVSEGKFNLTICDGSYYSKVATDNYVDGEWYHIIITWVASTNTASLYINNMLNDSAGSGTNGTATSNLTFGSKSTYHFSVSAQCSVSDTIIYDSILTTKERAKLYSEFFNSYPITKAVCGNLVYPKSTDLSREVDKNLNEKLVSDVTYGVVANNATKWSVFGTNTVAQIGQTVEVTYVNDDNGAYIYFRAATGTVTSNFAIGTKLRLTLQAKISTGGNCQLYYADDGGATLLQDNIINTDYQTFTFDITTTGANPYIRMNNMSAGEVFTIQIFSLISITGLIAAYNMIPTEERIIDITGQDQYGTLNTPIISTKEGLLFNGVNDNVSLFLDAGPAATVKTVCFRIKLKTTTEPILEGEIADHFIYATAGFLTAPDYDNVFVDGVDDNGIVADQWHNIVVVSSTSVSNVTATLGLNDTTYGAFEIADLKFYNYEFTEQEATEYHNQWSRKVEYKSVLAEDFGVGQDENNLSGYIMFDSGAFSVQELSAQDANVPQLDKGSKYLLCDTDGSFKIPLTSTNAIIDYYDGSNWSRKEDTLVNLIINNAWLSQSGNYLVFTLTAGTGIASESISRLGGGMLIPDSYLTTRSGLSLLDSVGSANATIKKFPMVHLLTSGTAYSRFETEFNSAVTGDWTMFTLYKKNGETESRLRFRPAEWNMVPAPTFGATPNCNYGNPLYFPPVAPTVTMTEWQLIGLKYDVSEDNVSSLWNGTLETVEQTLSQSLQVMHTGTVASYTDAFCAGIYLYNRLLSDAELEIIRTTGVFPTDNCLVAYPFINSGDTIWFEQFDGVARLGGNSTYHGWLTSGSTILPPTAAFDTRANDAILAYNLYNGFSQQGVHQIPYKPDGTKGAGGETGDIEHSVNDCIHNMADSYVDFNPANHSMNWATDADKIYAMMDKSNRTLWKASIETVNEGDHYIQNGDGNYTLWHPDEMNEDFVNTHAETGHAGHVFFGLRTSGTDITGITSIARYKENQV